MLSAAVPRKSAKIFVFFWKISKIFVIFVVSQPSSRRKSEKNVKFHEKVLQKSILKTEIPKIEKK